MSRLTTRRRSADRSIAPFLLAVTVAVGTGHGQGQPPEGPTASPGVSEPVLTWDRSPNVIKFGDYARIKLPSGMKCRFGNRETARAFVRDAGKELQQKLVGVIIPLIGEEGRANWRMTFAYDQLGYVRVDNPAALDPDVLLSRYQKGLGNLNDRRRLAGQPEIQEFAWAEPPVYDANLHQIRWTIRSVIPGGDRIECGVCCLGRHGVMTIKFEATEKDFEVNKKDVQGVAAGFQFTQGNRYEDYREGDKVAVKRFQDLVIGPTATSRMAVLKAFLTSTAGLALIVGGSILFLAIVVGLVVWIARGKGKAEPVVP